MPPDAQQNGDYVAPGLPPIVFEGFSTLNTNSTRPGIQDQECYWLDGFMPVGPNYLRTMPGIGSALYTAPGALLVEFFDFYNIVATPYSVVVQSDGSIVQVNTTTKATTPIAPAGTIQNPTRLNVGISQWGSQYLILVSKQTNGYWLWDGSTLYGAGGIAPGIVITDGGSGYSNSTTAAISGGSGSGAVLSVVVTGGVVTAINIVNAGTGYIVTDTVTVVITDPTMAGTGATATATLMPFGISGDSVETYTSRVWVSNGAIVEFTAPGSPSDFTTADGGGTFTSTDSFLRVGFTQLRQSNGFLYLIADSSVNYISGVQTSAASPPVTTFTNQNADPEIGTPWPATVDVFSRNILFANAFGAHVSYGGAVTKISENLDGVYNTVPNFGGLTPSAAKAIVYGKKIWVLLLPIINPITGQQENKLFCMMQQGNRTVWWSTSQDVSLVFVQHQEINSVLTAYGTDGSSIYPMFQQPSTAFQKTAQSKLWAQPIGYQEVKSADRLWGLVQYYDNGEPELTVSIDNENGSSPTTYDLGPGVATWTNASGQVVPWTNQFGATVVWTVAAIGIVVFPPQKIGQNGVLLGLTVQTNAADMALISLMIAPQGVQYRG